MDLNKYKKWLFFLIEFYVLSFVLTLLVLLIVLLDHFVRGL